MDEHDSGASHNDIKCVTIDKTVYNRTGNPRRTCFELFCPSICFVEYL